ncbi:MAG: hypothetical protein J6H20_01800 [Pyramidobacter sp.]|nr:hypothetical protein [Pyramidobacter sp.]MBP3835562.1 hypothetical protein [Pyramidobacter sp.]
MTPMSRMRRLLWGAAAALAAFLIVCALPASAVQQYEKDVVSFSETTLLKDAETRQHFLEEIEASFLKDYELLWKRENMLGKLTAAADAAFADKLSSSRLTGAIQVAMDLQNVVSDIQQSISEAFEKEYRIFLTIVEDYFTETYLDRLSAYDKALEAVRVGALTSAPSVRMFFQERVLSAAERGSVAMNAELMKKVAHKPELSLTSSAVFAGAWLSRRLIRRTLGRKALSVFGGGLGKKIFAAATGVGTLVTMGWALYDIGSFSMEVWDSPTKLRESLITHYDAYYRKECPQLYWQELRKGVREELDEILRRMARRDEDTKAIMASSAFRRLTDLMSEEEQKVFIDRLISVRPLDDSVSYSAIVENFSTVLQTMENEDISTLRDILAQGDLLMARQWFGVAGKEYFLLFRGLPREIWGKYLPSTDSLSVLSWLLQQPAAVRTALARFSSDEAAWLMREVPSDLVPRFFTHGRSDEEIRLEFERMKKLPKADRTPWQSQISFYLHYIGKWGFYAICAVGLFVLWHVLRCFF